MGFAIVVSAIKLFNSNEGKSNIFSKDNKYGYKVGDEINVPATFDVIGDFENGIAEGIRNDSIFSISENGKIQFLRLKNTDESKVEIADEDRQKDEKENKDDIAVVDLAAQMNDEYKNALQSSDIRQMENFLIKWPKSPYRDELKKSINDKIQKLEIKNESELYQKVKSSKSISLIDKYLIEYPAGKNAANVKGLKIEILEEKESDGWKKTVKENNIASYNQFILSYPKSTKIEEAKRRIKSLEDEMKWKKISDSDNIADFEKYLRENPTGKHAVEARKKILDLKTRNKIHEVSNTLSKFAQEIIAKNTTAKQDKELASILKTLKKPTIDNSTLISIKSNLDKINEAVEKASEELVLPPIILELEDDFVTNTGFKTHILGCNSGDCEKDESPTTQVDIGPFAIGKYEVSQRFWNKIMKKQSKLLQRKSIRQLSCRKH